MAFRAVPVLPILILALAGAGCRNVLPGSEGPAADPEAAAPGATAAGAEALPEGLPDIEGLEGVDPELLEPGPWEFTGYYSGVALPGAKSRDGDWSVNTLLNRLRLKVYKKVGLGATLQVDGVYENRQYNFDGPTGILAGTDDPVSVVNGFGLRTRYIQPFHPEWAVFASGRLRLEAEKGTPLTDGVSWAAVLGIGHRFPFGLDLGVGVGYIERPGNETFLVPIVQLDWEVSEVLEVSLDGLVLQATARTSEAWAWSVGAGFDSARIRLTDDPPGNSGIFTDSRFTVQVGSTWTPVEDLDFQLRLGLDVYRELFFADRNGDNSTGYQLRPGPVIGFRMAVRF